MKLLLIISLLWVLTTHTGVTLAQGCNVTSCDNTINETCTLQFTESCAMRCSNASSHSLDQSTPGSSNCIRNLETTDRVINDEDISPGIYILPNYRFCVEQCIERILLSSNDTDADVENAVQFHLLTRYRDLANPPVRDLYMQKLSFNVTLQYNSDFGGFEAIPNAVTCVESGDYFGINFKRNLSILSRNGGSTDGYLCGSETTCSGSSSPVFEVNPEGFSTRLPLIRIEYSSTTTELETPSPTTSDQSNSTTGTTAETIAPTTSTSMTSAATTPTTPTTPTTTVPGPSIATNTDNSLIVAVSSVVVIIAFLTAIVVLVTVCLCVSKSNQKRRDRLISLSSGQNFGSPSLISMGTYNSEYIENHNFQPPGGMRRVETVENPAAEIEEYPDHHYHDPTEMNAARALPVRPTTITNVHYGMAGMAGSSLPPEPSSPQYQDPDELASTPMIQRNRNTLKNPLYSTTGEAMPQMQGMNSQGEIMPIYDQPVELGGRSGSAANTLSNGISPSGMDIYREPEDSMLRPRGEGSSGEGGGGRGGGVGEGGAEFGDGGFGTQYSEPVVSTGTLSKVVMFSASATEQIHNYHELEPNSEVMPSTGHHYHLLDSRLDDDSRSNRGSLLRSNVHHIVNEPGAYVPDTEERKALLAENDTLAVKKLDDWKKSSYKAKKFFIKTEEYWAPSKDENVLFDQLNRKKFREILKDQLEFESHLGQGQFGNVQKAKWGYSGGSKEVAVKIMKASALPGAKLKFLQEGAILGQFFHSNVIKLYGLVTVSSPVMIVMEYMEMGDLLSYLQKNYKPAGAAPPHPKTLLSFCRQIACGMKYLSRMHFVHRDLAARNIFVSEALICKIGDFGMSRNLLDEEYYVSHGGVVPVKWTAPEGLNYKKYTTASDVYSYGMTLYEIWSLGEKPLKDVPQEQVARVTSGGYCQPPPPGTPRKIYHIMVQCWNPQHSRRPSFDELFEFLNSCDDDLLNWLKEDRDNMTSPHSQNIGCPLELGECLYKDLQKTYQGATSDM